MVCQRLLKVLGFATLICLVHANWKAIRTTTKVETFCSDVNKYTTWTAINDSNCNTNLQQVFKLLYRSDNRILIGSTECLYFLDENLTYIHSIPIVAADLTDCMTTFGDQAEFQCKNYITYAHPIGSSYRVCGTYNKIDPTCWICNETMLQCENEMVVNFMPRYPTSNFTVTVAGDIYSDYYYVGSLRRFNDKDYQFSKVEVNLDANRYDAEVKTDTTNDRYIWDRTSFVGSIERDEFIYFFYREKAREYSNIGNIVYSRVARVCKNDIGGAGTLGGNFVTFLKTRLMCSVGSEYPFIFNEIQDVFQSPSYDTDNLIYGLFTNPNAGLSSTAICRYNMSEIDKLFNEDARRGQPSADMQWQKIDIVNDDSEARRSCSGTFPSSLYTYLRDYPLMNTNAPNCGLTTTCEDYTRESDEALAVFEGIRGQQLVVLNDNGIKVYVGTNNNTVYEASINNSAVIITKQINIKADISMLTDEQIQNKWPLAVTYLEVNGDDIIGTLDNMVFKFTPDTMEGGQILDRSPSVYEVYFPKNVPNATVEIFKLFEGPSSSDITASFSGDLMIYNCSQKTFRSSGSGKREFLAVLCEISEVSSNTTLVIKVSSDSVGLTNTFSVAVILDETALAECDPSQVNQYDHDMADYRYRFKNWLNNHVTCDAGTKDTCPSASAPGM